MKALNVSQFEKAYKYEQAKKQARKADIGRRSGRRGTGSWGKWAESE